MYQNVRVLSKVYINFYLHKSGRTVQLKWNATLSILFAFIMCKSVLGYSELQSQIKPVLYIHDAPTVWTRINVCFLTWRNLNVYFTSQLHIGYYSFVAGCMDCIYRSEFKYNSHLTSQQTPSIVTISLLMNNANFIFQV